MAKRNMLLDVGRIGVYQREGMGAEDRHVAAGVRRHSRGLHRAARKQGSGPAFPLWGGSLVSLASASTAVQ